MEHGGLLAQAAIYLVAAVAAVPLATRLGLGAVLGYLLAGVAIGPFVLQLVGDQTDVMHFAEFGVVMMLFLIGLELKPQKLWRLRGAIVGLGGSQLLLSTLLALGLLILLGLPWQWALAIGLILSMSSTAIALQTLQERKLARTYAGQRAFSVLLFQDIAVIPMLALLPLLAISQEHSADGGVHWGWQVAAVLVVVVGGRFALRPLFALIAQSGSRELFTATALLIVVATALAMQWVGLSPALGAFLAGVVLAESEYRHQLETDLEPFKGLLLGLFFISVGASIDFKLFIEKPLLILLAVVALFGIKALVLLLVGYFGRLRRQGLLAFVAVLAGGGEFAFVLFAYAQQNQVLPADLTNLLSLAVALSMLLTPLLYLSCERLLLPLWLKEQQQEQPDEEDIDEHQAVIVVGFGRFGQIVGRLLMASGQKVTILENDAAHLETARRFGYKIYYGDSTRVDLLQSAGAAQAKLMIIAVDDVERSIQIAKVAQQHFPQLRLLVRAQDRQHAYQLLNMGIGHVYRESLGSSLDMGVDALRELGMRGVQAVRLAQAFKRYDEQHLREMAPLWQDQQAYLSRSRQLREQLDDVLADDDKHKEQVTDHSWEKASH